MAKTIYSKTVLAIDPQGNRLTLTFEDTNKDKCLKKADTAYKLLSLVEGVRVRYQRIVQPKVKSEA